MKIPGAADRAAQRMRQTATPLYNYITQKLGGETKAWLEAGPGALTFDKAKSIQRSGFRGFLDLFIFEKPRGQRRKNKFTKLGALNFSGLYPKHLLNARGRELLYDEKPGQK